MRRLIVSPKMETFLPSKFFERMDEKVSVIIFETTVVMSLQDLRDLHNTFRRILEKQEQTPVAGEYPAVTFVRLDKTNSHYIFRQKPGSPYTITFPRELNGALILVFLDATAEDFKKKQLIFTKPDLFLADLEYAILLSLLNKGRLYRMTDNGIVDMTAE